MCVGGGGILRKLGHTLPLYRNLGKTDGPIKTPGRIESPTVGILARGNTRGQSSKLLRRLKELERATPKSPAVITFEVSAWVFPGIRESLTLAM